MTLINLTQPEYCEIYNQIRQAHLEYLGYRNIIMYMIDNNMRESDQYKIYFKEFIDKLGQYEIIKEKFSSFLREKNSNINFNNWEIIFEKDVVQLD